MSSPSRPPSAVLILDHIALIVQDLDSCAAALGLPLGKVEEHDTENTREVYAEISPVSVLLVQPRSSSGPIARHVQRRGPGFHHIAFRTRDAGSILENLRGWYICPSTFRNLKRKGPAWLVRPDLGLLLEIVSVDQDIIPTGHDVFRRICIEVPNVERCRGLLQGIGAFDEKFMLLRPGDGRIRHVELDVGGRRVLLDMSGTLSFPDAR
jgi:catechol 2,3-dioxygenase-like lactoylglutathione lyase family enzyme